MVGRPTFQLKAAPLVADVVEVTNPTSSPVGVTSIIPAPKMSIDGAPALVFQPAVDLATGRLLGFEALLRWQDSSGVDIPPNVLIPRAEADGTMNALNAWVLAESCAQAVLWPSDLQLAVNCSLFQLHRGTAALAAASALEQSGLNPDRLTVEVTESSVADHEAVADMQVMSRLGIQLTVDDVGTDWSVIENLQDCVVNTVKIDASLTSGLTSPDGQSRSTVERIVERCRTSGICTVAEAVETGEQVAILREIGAETAQGYFFSPPLRPADAAELAGMIPHPRFALTSPQ